jgi:hypothetical protein
MAKHLWTCPYCDRNATIREDDDFETDGIRFGIKTAEGFRHLTYTFVVCPNPNCKKFTLVVSLQEINWDGAKRKWVIGEAIKNWNLVPPSQCKTFPSYIPQAILDDYNEACLIVSLSPKASATLSRRCLQGIIRDFWKVKPGRLIDEIDHIKDKVDPLTWGAIESVRKVGNIGAHMEKDINLILDVDPKEAELLIQLIEILLRDWYIAREEKKQRLTDIKKTIGYKAKSIKR